MLDRISTEPLLPELPSAKQRHRQNERKSRERINVFTTPFRNALKKSVEGIIEAGRGQERA
jgi:hypothetical protein